MSRADLDQIQGQLKLAIQSHQVLVGQMKSDPQNGFIQKQLHELQAQITSLSEKQKYIVQQLRKELVPKPNLTATKSKPRILQSSSAPPSSQQQQQPINLCTNHHLNNNNNNVIKTSPTKASSQHVHHPRKQRPPKQRPQQQQQQQDPVSLHKPSILSGSHHRSPPSSALKRSHVSSSTSSSSARKTLDSEALRISSHDKELSPSERKKLEFMAAIDLITPEALKEIQSRRSERKRRSTANPQFSYGAHMEPERRKVARYMTPQKPSSAPPPLPQQPQAPRKRGRPPKRQHHSQRMANQVPEPACLCGDQPQAAAADPVATVPGDIHEDFCALCQRSGELLMCDTCNLVYHLACLEPPLTTIPKGLWSCPKCKALGKTQGSNWPGTLALVQSYITAKSAKEEEKKSLLSRNHDLLLQQKNLQLKTKELSSKVAEEGERHEALRQSTEAAQDGIDKLHSFLQALQS
ncbi:hypothetical protein CAPTEDRAFT_220123 [Capitella teleta]|uniref:PHD-type domain-containing protein n=1 Tax=Capitella teleta TaxID=283909 RepID=R7UJ98_CAPTE|nr:hypothetical protein CAPTEDRAFT_220123 [Capitella teleta]|eukprot:ELU06619.1 hypothetical protein CAPTEDRAFT_220123 [Capitella teleta]